MFLKVEEPESKRHICCSKCGKSTGLQHGPLHMVIPAGGVKCSNCGTVVIQGSQISLYH